MATPLSFPVSVTPDARVITGTTVTTPEGRPCWYPDTAILTDTEVGAVLGVSEKTVNRYPIRRAFCSDKTVRYLYRDVIAFLESRAA